jgi:hypothetical protein
VAELIDILQKAFGDPDRKATALANLQKLKQANRTFPEYYAQFPAFMAEIDDGDGESAKKNTLLGGVSYELHDDMIHHDGPGTLHELVKDCRTFGRR